MKYTEGLTYCFEARDSFIRKNLTCTYVEDTTVWFKLTEGETLYKWDRRKERMHEYNDAFASWDYFPGKLVEIVRLKGVIHTVKVNASWEM